MANVYGIEVSGEVYDLEDTNARSTATSAASIASSAVTKADTAQSTADTAETKADTAQSTANTAKSTADAAQSTANTAKSTADTAQSTADTANTNLATLEQKAVTHTPNTAVGNTNTPVYVGSDGVPRTITKATTVTSGSASPVTSGGVYDFLTTTRTPRGATSLTRVEGLPQPGPSLIHIWDSSSPSNYMICQFGTEQSVQFVTVVFSSGLSIGGAPGSDYLVISGSSGVLKWRRIFEV